MLLGAVLVGCAGDSSEQFHCDDLLSAQISFTLVMELVVEPGSKSCASCHNTRTPVFGLNFEGPAVAYDALTTKMQLIYPQVASGRMPQVGEAWAEADLQILRTWYCKGAFYAEAD